MEEMLKNLVKEAVMEALNEVMNQNVAVASEAPADDKKKPIRPKPNVGVGGFSLR